MEGKRFRLKLEANGGLGTWYAAIPDDGGWLYGTQDRSEAMIFEDAASSGGSGISTHGQTMRLVECPAGNPRNKYCNGNWYLGADYWNGLAAMQYDNCSDWSAAGVVASGKWKTSGKSVKLDHESKKLYAYGNENGKYIGGRWTKEPEAEAALQEEVKSGKVMSNEVKSDEPEWEAAFQDESTIIKSEFKMEVAAGELAKAVGACIAGYTGNIAGLASFAKDVMNMTLNFGWGTSDSKFTKNAVQFDPDSGNYVQCHLVKTEEVGGTDYGPLSKKKYKLSVKYKFYRLKAANEAARKKCRQMATNQVDDLHKKLEELHVFR